MNAKESRPPGSLQRMVRRLAGLLLGERNAINLYGEDDTTQRFEAEAKRIGATVVACDFPTGYNPLLERVVYPLPDSEEKQREEKQNQVSLRNGFGFDGDRADQARTANNCEGVPPVINLQPGERISHMMVWPPNS